MLQADYQYYPLYFKRPGGTSRGVLHNKDSWILRIWDSENPQQKGWGECSIIPKLSIDNPTEIPAKLTEVCRDIANYKYWLDEGLIDFPAIKFALETALLDWQNGGKHILFPSPFSKGKKSIPINGLLWMGSTEFMEEQLQEKIKQNFGCIKMKVGAIDTKEELQLLQKIRKENSNIILRIDANGAYTPENAMRYLTEFYKLNIHSIEQPIKAGQWDEMAMLCKKTPLPIVLDEELIGIHSFMEKESLLRTIQPQYIILKPSLLGGFFASQEWIALAEKYNIGWWITSALEGNIGLNAIAQWTATLGITTHQGLGTGSLFTNNIASPLELRGEELWYNPQKSWGCF